MKKVIFPVAKHFEYPDYIGVMTALRAFGKENVEVRAYKATKPQSKYLGLIEKLGILTETEEDLIAQAPDTLILPTSSLTLEKFNAWIPTQGSFLFDSKDSDSIPDKNLKFVSFPKKNMDEEFVANSDTIYSELVKKLLLERVWNPFKKPIWGVEMAKPLIIKQGKKKFTFHMVGNSHLPVTNYYSSCAFTMKHFRLSKMLMSLGHKVYCYGAKSTVGEMPECTEFIETHTVEDIRNSWGSGDNREEIGYNWRETQFKNDYNSSKKPATRKFFLNSTSEIKKRKEKDHFLLLMQGQYHDPVRDAVGLFLNCEPGIGYRGSSPRNFRAFESAWLQHFTWGSEHPRGNIKGDYHSRVIPNYYDPLEFGLANKKKDYYLYIGRMIQRKGVWTAIKATRAMGAKLLLAGQPDPEIDVKQLPDNCEYLGQVDSKRRKILMSEAIATFVPTIYLEPFGGVAVESMLCGTPAITTNFGAFVDTVVDGLNGYRCNTLQDFVDAAKAAGSLNPKTIRESAQRYTTDNVKMEFQKWFEDLYRLWESTEDPKKKAWHHLE